MADDREARLRAKLADTRRVVRDLKDQWGAASGRGADQDALDRINAMIDKAEDALSSALDELDRFVGG